MQCINISSIRHHLYHHSKYIHVPSFCSLRLHSTRSIKKQSFIPINIIHQFNFCSKSNSNFDNNNFPTNNINLKKSKHIENSLKRLNKSNLNIEQQKVIDEINIIRKTCKAFTSSSSNQEIYIDKVSKTVINSSIDLCQLANTLIISDILEKRQKGWSLYQEAIQYKDCIPEVYFNLGVSYYEGIDGVVDVDELKSLEMFHICADKYHDIDAMFWLGYYYITGSNGLFNIQQEEGELYLNKASTCGSGKASFYLAMMLDSNDQKHLQLLELAVKQGDSDAMFYFARSLLDESNDNILNDKAIQLLQQASDLAHAEATHTLAVIYYRGMCRQKTDKVRAFQYYCLAGEYGSLESWRSVAAMYYIGDGIPKSIESAKSIMQFINSIEKQINSK